MHDAFPFPSLTLTGYLANISLPYFYIAEGYAFIYITWSIALKMKEIKAYCI